jgi:predicted alpha/beta-hydrolase family hydrolase
VARPWFLFAHGAGAPSRSTWMRAWSERLQSLGHVTTFDYPYMRAGRKMPDRLPVLIAAHREALADLRKQAGDARVFLIGKSMGSRVGCHVSLEEPVDGLICMGYPLVSGRGTVRDEVLVALRTPILFVQGTHDTLCPIPHLTDARARMTAPNQLHVVADGNHSLELPGVKRTPGLQQQSDLLVLDAIRNFVDDIDRVPLA